MLAVVFALCDELKARKCLPVKPTNRELARRYAISVRTVTNWRREGCPFEDGQWRVLDWMHERRYLPRRTEREFSRQLKRRAWTQFGNSAALLKHLVKRLGVDTSAQYNAMVRTACEASEQAIRRLSRWDDEERIETISDLRRAAKIAAL